MDRQLTYGREQIVEYVIKECSGKSKVSILDIGAGHGIDLTNIKRSLSPNVKTDYYGIERYGPNVEELKSLGVNVCGIDIEKDNFPYDDQSFDVVIANQVLEHMKEIFWIFSEVSRILKVGGIFIIGVPNLASLHNRVLLMFGKQPSFIYTMGPHVRGYTYKDFKDFIEADGYFRVEGFRGANFYPFSPMIAKPLARLFPKASAGLIIMARRNDRQGEFIHIFDNRFFETNYYCGNGKTIFERNLVDS